MNWKFHPSASTRKYVVADPVVQGAILRRVGLYTFATILYYCVVLAFHVFGSDRDGTTMEKLNMCLDDAITWVPGLFVIVPVAAYDLLATTNRFAGPICRLRGELRRLIDGDSPRPVKFREGDHWSDVAILFNEVRQEMLMLREQAKNANVPMEGSKRDAQQEPNVLI